MSEIITNDNLKQDDNADQKQNLLNKLFHNSTIQPSKEQGKTFWQKFLYSIDIFSFIPIPHSYPVSTKLSRIGSFLLIGVFLAYVLYDFIIFVTNNSPRVNTYSSGIQGHNYPIPETALAFIYGDPLVDTLDNSSFFTIQSLQLNVTAGEQSKQKQIQLKQCQNLDWLNPLNKVYKNLSCLSNTFNLSGVLFASETTFYPRFRVDLCNSKLRQDCAEQQQLFNMTSGGRIFLFMKQNQSINMATAKTSADNQFGKFKFFNYFMVPYVHGRVVITLQPVNYIVYPDYLTSWTTKKYLNMEIINNEYQISNVSQYNKQRMFSISILLSSQARTVEIVYSTSIDHIAIWGAFWGVLFSVFALFFLAYNRNQFYKKRPDWSKFEEKVDEFDNHKQMMQNYRNQGQKHTSHNQRNQKYS